MKRHKYLLLCNKYQRNISIIRLKRNQNHATIHIHIHIYVCVYIHFVFIVGIYWQSYQEREEKKKWRVSKNIKQDLELATRLRCFSLPLIYIAKHTLFPLTDYYIEYKEMYQQVNLFKISPLIDNISMLPFTVLVILAKLSHPQHVTILI